MAPATADLLARLAEGRADDLVAALALCAREVPVLVAPAMHPRMWSHPATQANVAAIARQGRVTFVGPVHGPVASGDVGLGRMSEPARSSMRWTRRWLRAISTAYGSSSRRTTLEDLDPVRFLGNRSSGKMGFAIASGRRREGRA